MCVRRSLTLKGRVRPAVTSGLLSRPLAGTPAEVARAYVDSDPDPVRGLRAADFRLDGTIGAHGGSIVKMKQTHGELDVIGAGVAVRIDAQGRVRWVGSSAATISPGIGTSPRIGIEEARARAALVSRVPITTVATAEIAGRLVIYRSGGDDFRLAWELLVPRTTPAPEAWRVFVDAMDGSVLAAENLTLYDRLATVYERDPVTTPALAEVSLDLPEGATALTSDKILGASCIDRHTCMQVGPQMWIRTCDQDQIAVANASGDFTEHHPPSDILDSSDAFAEVQAYYHVSEAYAFFSSLGGGDPLPNGRPIAVVVNFRMPDMSNPYCDGPEYTGQDELQPLDNAFFSPGIGQGPDATDTIFLGQGRVADFSYDGDVVHHELTHAIMWSQTELSAVYWQRDSYGIDPSPGGLNEGFPDYFSGALAGDPVLGAYSSKAFVEQGAAKSLDNTAACPTDLCGEAHLDSRIWAGALWEVRSALPEQHRQLMDRAVYAVMASLDASDGFETAQAKLVAEIEVAIDAQTADLAESVFRRRGLNGCNKRVVEVEEMGKDPIGHPLMLSVDMDWTTGAAGTLPSPVQFKLAVPTNAGEIVFRAEMFFDEAGSGPGSGPAGTGAQPSVLLIGKPGGEPILWTWKGSQGTHDATLAVALACTSGGCCSGSLAGSLAAGEYHLQLVNQGTSQAVLDEISFGYTPSTSEAEADAGTPGDNQFDEDSSQADGCGCHLGGRPRGDGIITLLVFAVLGLFMARSNPSSR
ncbi:MAG: hypothetical protein V2A73_20890 [Pseudomonadota bacterium]